MNIMIVEDEPPILREIEYYIRKFGEPFHIVATALNGQQAREILDERGDDIDFLLTDIQIPIMNGLELVAYVKEHHPSILCSILTGYNDFSYAQKAIRLQVLDYLSKPIEEEVLREQLQHAYEIKFVHSLTRSDDIVSAKEHNLPALEDSAEALYYRQILVQLGQYSSSPDYSMDEYTNTGRILEQTLISFNANHSSFLKYWLISETGNCTFYILFSLSAANCTAFQSFVESYYEELKRQLPMVTIVFDEEDASISNIGKHTNTLKKSMSNQILFEISSLIHQGETVPDENTELYQKMIAAVPSLAACFRKGNHDLFAAELGAIIPNSSRFVLRQNSLYEFLLTTLTECLVPYLSLDILRQVRPSDLAFDVIMLSSNMSQLLDNFLSVVDDLMTDITSETNHTMHNTNVLAQVDRYIRNHYTEDISTKSIATDFGFTPAYLSKLFREYSEKTPSEYITALRIAKSKDMFKTSSNLTIREVAEYVGYPDALYFSKVFKKETGLSPKAYCNTLRA